MHSLKNHLEHFDTRPNSEVVCAPWPRFTIHFLDPSVTVHFLDGVHFELKMYFRKYEANSLVQSNKNNCQSHEHNSSYILWCADIGVFEVRFPIDQDRLNLTIILDLNLTFGSFKMILNHWENTVKWKSSNVLTKKTIFGWWFWFFRINE